MSLASPVRYLVLLALAAASANAQTSLTLIVRDAGTAAPLAGAQLVVSGVSGSTDAFGRADLLGVEPGQVRIEAAYSGYIALDTTIAIEQSVSNLALLPLRPDLEMLGDVVVEAESVNDAVLRRRGFFERRETRSGVFRTREELDRRGASQFADVFRGVPGVRVQRRGGVTSLVSTRRRGCLMQMYIDGTEMTYLAGNVDAVPFDDIAAVEVYRGPAEVPLEYTQTKSQETCGAVLVWTRIVASNR